MDANMAGDDASLDAAIAKITQKITPEDVGAAPAKRTDARENREDRDVTQEDDYSDLEALEAAERAEKAQTKQTNDGDERGEERTEAQADDDAIVFELPAAEDGADPVKVTRKEAAEAVQKIRQLDGDVAQAVIKAEEEAYQKHDQVTQALTKAFDTVSEQARIALEMMHAWAPQEPDARIVNDPYATAEEIAQYHQAKQRRDAFVRHYNQVRGTLKQAQDGSVAVGGQQDAEVVRRETARAARYIPGYDTDQGRATWKADIIKTLGPKYGFAQADVDEITDHRAIRVLHDLAKAVSANAKAPEVRKQLQEKVTKVTNGALPERDKTGRFISDARKELKDTGSEDAFAKLLMRSGALKGL